MKVSLVILMIVMVSLLAGCVASTNATTPPLLLNEEGTPVGVLVPATYTPASPPSSGNNPQLAEITPTATGDGIDDLKVFPVTSQQVISLFAMERVAEAEVTVCPDGRGGIEPYCWRVLREKDKNNNVIPFFIGRNGTGCWQDGWRVIPGEERPGGYTQPNRSGVPPVFSGEVEGITIRPCSLMGLTSVNGDLTSQPTAVPMATATIPTGPTATPIATATALSSGSAVPTASVEIATFPNTAQEVVEIFALNPDEVEITEGCDGEKNCWRVRGKNGGFFHMLNPWFCWIDGYRATPGEVRPGQTDPKTSIPPSFSGMVEVANIRLCTTS